jgi:hypothetical protein
MRIFRPSTVLRCGGYAPAPARIVAGSVKAIRDEYRQHEDPVFRTRALIVEEQGAEFVKDRPWVACGARMHAGCVAGVGRAGKYSFPPPPCQRASGSPHIADRPPAA